MQLEEWLEDSEAGEQEEKGYADVTVREAVEWTLSKDSDFVYVDVRSAEEHEKLATPRYTTTCACMSIHCCTCNMYLFQVPSKLVVRNSHVQRQ